MRLGERHKHLLPTRGCPGLIHGLHATAAVRPCQPNFLAPLQGAKSFFGRGPRVVAARQPWANFRYAFSVVQFASIREIRVKRLCAVAPWRLGVEFRRVTSAA
jgi:hypothetical protein